MSASKGLREARARILTLEAENEELTFRLASARNTLRVLIGELPSERDRKEASAGYALGRLIHLEDVWKAFVTGCLETIRLPQGSFDSIERKRLLFDQGADAYIKLLIERENPKRGDE